MTIKMLKKKIENLPDNMRICADDGDCGMFSNNSEFVALVPYKNMCVIQTKKDFDVSREIIPWYEQVKLGNIDENTFWNEFYELGYDYDDFNDFEMRKKALEYKKRRANL